MEPFLFRDTQFSQLIKLLKVTEETTQNLDNV